MVLIFLNMKLTNSYSLPFAAIYGLEFLPSWKIIYPQVENHWHKMCFHRDN